jgi:hypothetical protein
MADVDLRRGYGAPVLPQEGKVGRKCATKGKQESDLNGHLTERNSREEGAPLAGIRRGVLDLDHVPFDLDETPVQLDKHRGTGRQIPLTPTSHTGCHTGPG